jgi:hypothetical protein
MTQPVERRPVCFVIMPFGVKPVKEVEGPAEVDFTVKPALAEGVAKGELQEASLP